MRILLISLTLLLSGLQALAGGPPRLPPPPDSLRAVLRAAPPHTMARTEALLRIATAFMEPLDSAGTVLYAEAAEASAKSLGDKLNEARAQGLRGEYYRQAADLIRAAPLLQKSQQALTGGPRPDYANAIYRLGMLFGDLGRAERAHQYYREAYRLFGAVGDRAQQGEVLNSIGLLYQYDTQYDSAAWYLFRAVRLQHQLGRRLAEAAALGNVAVMLYGQRRYAEGSKYARQAYKLELAEGDTIALATTLEYLGGFALGADSLRRALWYFHQSLEMTKRKRLNGIIGNSYSNIAKVYEQLENLDSARLFYRESMRLGSLSGRVNDVGQRMAAFAEFFSDHHEPDSAVFWANKALALGRNQPGARFLRMPLQVLRLAAIRNHDYARAYDLLEQQRQLEISLQKKDNEQLSEELRIGYESEQAQQQIQLLTQDRELADLRRQRELAGSGAVLLVLGGVGFGYRRRQQRRQQELESANQRKDLLMSIVGHDLRGLVAGFQQVGPLLRGYAQQPNPAAELMGFAHDIEADANRLSALLDNLLHWARTQTGDVINQPQALPVGPVVADTLRLYRAVATAKEINLLAELPSDIPAAFADPFLVGTVLRNLLSNAVKFTPRGGRVTVTVELTGRTITLAVTDTGPGLPPGRLTSLVEPVGALSTPGTAGEVGTGLGLAVSHAFVKLFGVGELRVANLPGGGAKLWFSLPVMG